MKTRSSSPEITFSNPTIVSLKSNSSKFPSKDIFQEKKEKNFRKKDSRKNKGSGNLLKMTVHKEHFKR